MNNNSLYKFQKITNMLKYNKMKKIAQKKGYQTKKKANFQYYQVFKNQKNKKI